MRQPRPRRLLVLALLILIPLLQVLLVAFKLPSWGCPLYNATGLRCPGCGMSRGAVALVKLDFRQSISYNAFTPILAAGYVAFVILYALPDRQYRIASLSLRKLERRTHIGATILFAFVLFGAIRLGIDFFRQ